MYYFHDVYIPEIVPLRYISARSTHELFSNPGGASSNGSADFSSSDVSLPDVASPRFPAFNRQYTGGASGLRDRITDFQPKFQERGKDLRGPAVVFRISAGDFSRLSSDTSRTNGALALQEGALTFDAFVALLKEPDRRTNTASQDALRLTIQMIEGIMGVDFKTLGDILESFKISQQEQNQELLLGLRDYYDMLADLVEVTLGIKLEKPKKEATVSSEELEWRQEVQVLVQRISRGDLSLKLDADTIRNFVAAQTLLHETLVLPLLAKFENVSQLNVSEFIKKFTKILRKKQLVQVRTDGDVVDILISLAPKE